MFGLFLLVTLFGLVYLMIWMVQNDGASSIEAQTGLLRMIRPKPAPKPSADTPIAQNSRAVAPRPAAKPHSKSKPKSTKSSLAPPVVETISPLAEDDGEEIVHPLWQGRQRPRR